MTTIDPSQINIPDDAWEFVDVTEDFVRHRAVLERYPDGTVTYVYRRKPRQVQAMLEDNQRLKNESDGTRWGDGKVVGRIPLNILYRDLVPKIREGDKDHLKWWLGRSENEMFRTRRGRL